MNIFQTIYNNTKIRCMFAVCMCLSIAAMVQVMVTMAFARETDITEAFAMEDNVDIRKCSIEGTACLNVDMQSFDEKAVLLLENVTEAFGMEHTKQQVTFSDRDGFSCYVTECNTEELDYHATVSWSDKMDRAYLHCRIYVKSSADRMEQAYKMLDSVLRQSEKAGYISDNIIYTAVEADCGGRMSESDCEEYTDIMFGRLGAKRITDGGTGYYTVYGYTPDISDSIQSNDRRINVQASYSYDEENDVTRICLGSPVLNMDY